jgi:hypothetical protein
MRHKVACFLFLAAFLPGLMCYDRVLRITCDSSNVTVSNYSCYLKTISPRETIINVEFFSQKSVKEIKVHVTFHVEPDYNFLLFLAQLWGCIKQNCSRTFCCYKYGEGYRLLWHGGIIESSYSQIFDFTRWRKLEKANASLPLRGEY